MTALAQRSFAGGELAPSLHARTDLTKYASGARTIRNLLIQRHGGLTNRAGTPFINEVKDSTKVVRIIRYAKSASETYLLELGDFYMRVVKLGAQVNVGGVFVWNGATNYVVGDLALQAGINYYCVQANVAQAPPNATYWYPLSGSIYEIPTPWAAADLAALDYAQSANVITFTHASYAPYELTRLGDTRWTLAAVVFAPTIAAPPAVAAPTGGVGGKNVGYAITAIAAETFEESLPTASSILAAACTLASPVDVTWNAVPGAASYVIYRATFPTFPYPAGYAPTYNFIGTSVGTAFRDEGLTPDPLKSPPIARNPFPGAGDYPAAVGYYQERRVFAASNNKPETIWGSRTGESPNFTVSFPIQADDAVTFSMVGAKSNAIKHLADLGRLIVFTAAQEKMVEGDQEGILRPDSINPRKLSANGSGSLKPIELDDSAIYVQARGTKVRDFKPVSADAYEGTDLTIFAAHLFDGYTLADWDYADNPHSIVWIVRSDGTLLGLTYIRDQAVWGWHRHDTDGVFENVCVVPEGNEDAVYFVVRRTINGATKRYIERMASRFFTAITDANFLDASVSIDGRNNGAVTMTVSGGVNWDELETLTLTASIGSFVAGDVGNSIFLTAADGTEHEFKLEGFTSNVVMTGHLTNTLPVDLRGVATLLWAKGLKVVTGLAHLEAKKVGVFADGYVVASPNNSRLPFTATVVAGQIVLDRAYKQIKVGLSFISDVETLNIDSSGANTITDKKSLIGRLGLFIEKSRGIFAGKSSTPTTADPLKGLQEFKARESESYSQPVSLTSGKIEIPIESTWDDNGRVFVRQVDPLPLTINAIFPIGQLPAAA